MTRLQRRTVFGFLFLAGLLGLVTARSHGQGRAGGGPAEGFLKIGRHYINVDWIAFTTEENNKTLRVHFGGGQQQDLLLNGDQANEMRQWLDRNTIEPSSPSRRKPLMEGVDILETKPRDPRSPAPSPRR